MSTYDMIAGRRFYAPLVFAVMFPGVEPSSVPRLRDAYFNERGEVELLSKTGPNAWHGQEENSAYRKLPGYLGEGETCWDDVYAKWRYELPADKARKQVLVRAFEVVGSYDPMAEMRRILDDMKAGRITPEVTRAVEAGRPIAEQIQTLMRTGKGGFIKLDDEA